MKNRMKVLPYLFIAPTCILILIFKIAPIISTLLEGFTFKNEFSLKTYQYLFEDSQFWKSLWVTIKFNLIITPVQVILALALALLVNVKLKGIGIFRTIIYLPVTISMTVATVLWNMMLKPDNGIFNSILAKFGIESQGFLTDPKQAMWSIIVISTWIGVGYWMMFLLAGLKNIDESVYEAAKVDGSNWFNTTMKITLPLLKKVLLFVVVADTTTNLLLFAPMQLITKGGPMGTTNVLMYEAYKSAFQYADRPRSSAIITVLLLLILSVCVVQFKLLSDKEEA